MCFKLISICPLAYECQLRLSYVLRKGLVLVETLDFGKFCYLGSKIFSMPHSFFSLRIKLGKVAFSY